MENLEKDLLNRKPVAEALMKIIKNKKNLKVLAIDSEWGTGKTTFIKIWIEMLKNENEYKDEYEVMYFNAWENDYLNEPLVALLIELDKEIKDKKGKVESFLNTAKEKGKVISGIGAEIAIKTLTRGVLESADLGKIAEEGMLELSNKIGKVMIDSISRSKKTRNELKQELKKFQKKIDKNVIIFIDELDRCRPTFAVELLETIKHIFDIENYKFVISVDKNQMACSIKTLYGQDMNSNGYLRRFFDLEYTLPKTDFKEYINLKNIELIQGENYDNLINFVEAVRLVFLELDYSLRDINKAYQFIEIIFNTLYIPRNNNYYVFDGDATIRSIVVGYIYAYFINLKIEDRELFEKVRNMKIDDYDEIIKKVPVINLNSKNCEFTNFDSTIAASILSGSVEKYLKVVSIENSYKNEFDREKYIKGLKEEEYKIIFNDRIENIFSTYKYMKIWDKLDFASSFKSE